MNKSADSLLAVHVPAQGAAHRLAPGDAHRLAPGGAYPLAHAVPRQAAYCEDAHSYDQRTRAFQSYRQAIVEALPVDPGQVVLDVGCGTGLCCGMLLEKVGSAGGVIGIEASPEMA